MGHACKKQSVIFCRLFGITERIIKNCYKNAACHRRNLGNNMGEGGEQNRPWVLGNLSARYSNRRDGIVMNSRITAGATLRVVSIIFLSRINRLACLFWISMIIKYISGVI